MRLVSALGTVFVSSLILGLAVGCTEEDGDGGGDSGGTGGSDGGAGSATGGTDASGGSETGGDATGGSSGGGEQLEACTTFPPEWAECGATSKSADYRTPNILLVIDKSGSMSDEPEGFGMSKWAALEESLSAALQTVAEDVNLGLILYPYNPEETAIECTVLPGAEAVQVAVEPATGAVSSIVGALRGTAPGGGTPTAEALKRAFEYYVNGEGKDLTGEKYVLLATDGGPNCNSLLSCASDRCTVNLDGQCTTDGMNCCETTTGASLGDRCLDDAAVKSQITALANRGIQTFVVGIPGTEVYADYLDEFAVAGGRVSGGERDYYAVSADAGVSGLTETFAAISTQLVKTCDIALDSPPPARDKVNVALDCEPVKQEETGGWVLSDDGLTITLTGDVCEQVETTGVKRVDVVLGCPVIR